MDLFEFILKSIWPWVKKVMTTLGIGIVTYEGVGEVGDQIRDQVIANFGLIGGNMLDILSLAGFPQAIGIILGAFAASLAMKVLGRLAILPVK